MRQDRVIEAASGAVYDRVMNRIKTGVRPVASEPATFEPAKSDEEKAEGRAQFGKRRVF